MEDVLKAFGQRLREIMADPTPEMVEGYAEHGIDQVTALVFATSAAEVEQAFDDLQPCFDAAARVS